jgi:hypothetical protein
MFGKFANKADLAVQKLRGLIRYRGKTNIPSLTAPPFHAVLTYSNYVLLPAHATGSRPGAVDKQYI